MSGKTLKKVATVVGIGTAVVTGGASLGLFGATAAAGGVAGGVAAAGAMVNAGAAAAGAAAIGSAGTFLGTAGTILNTVGNFISGVSSIAGSTARPVSSYMGAQSTAYAAKQASIDAITQAENFEYQAGVSDINASIAERNRVFEEQSQYATEQIMMRQNRKALATAKNMYSTAGVTMSGSALDVIADNAAEGALAIALKKFESFHRQKGFEITRDAAFAEKKQFEKAAVQSRKNAKSILEEGLAQSDAQKGVSFVEGLSAIPDVIEGINDVINIFNK